MRELRLFEPYARDLASVRIALAENERRALANELAITLAEIARTIVAGDQQPESVAAFLARELHGYVGIDDRTRVNCRHERTENVSAFKKERPLLWKENRETLIRGSDQRICLDLCEVGMHREIESDVWVKTVFTCQSKIEFDWLVNELACVKQAGVDLGGSQRSFSFPCFRDGQTGNQFECAFRRDSLKAGDMAGLRHPTAVSAINWHPTVEFVIDAFDPAIEVHAPKLVAACFVSK